MKNRTLLVLACFVAFGSSSVMAQNAPSVPDQAVFQSNVPQSASPAAPASTAAPVLPPMALPAPGGIGVAPVAPVAGGTARDQGYDGDIAVGPSLWEMETLRRRESPRQRGEKVEVSARSNGVATDPSQAAWFGAWAQRLVSIGVHPDKVRFEGRRLTQKEFAMWASRQVWAVEAGLIAP